MMEEDIFDDAADGDHANNFFADGGFNNGDFVDDDMWEWMEAGERRIPALNVNILMDRQEQALHQLDLR